LKILFAALAAATLAAFSNQASASDAYPSRPVRMIVPFAPGGASDFVGRVLQPKLSEYLGQQVVIDNRAGASGNIGVELAARSSPDGYTLLLGNVGTMAINPSMFPKFPVSPLRDFIGVSLVVDVPGAFAVHPSIPSNNVKEFIAYAKARPGKLNFGSSGSASAQGLAFEFFMRKAGIELVQIPYKGGAGAATAALLAGEVSATMVTVASFIPYVTSGRAKVLGVMAAKRVPSLPDVPTMAESGFAELTLGSWQALFLPKGTPPAVVTRVQSALMQTLADPQTVERLGRGGAVIATNKSPQEFAGFLKVQNDFWAKIIKQVGVTAE
jgi:tripartite-type tricarboxylate transporter receptor subunit TctC